MKYLILAATALTLASPAFADGDVAKGEKEFKKCKACHMIAGPDEVIQKGGKTGPNLYNVVGRDAGTYEDFKYSDVMLEAGEKGLVWTEENLIEYLPDPTAFLEEFSGDDKGRSKMTFRLKKGAEDVVAYLASVSPDAGAAAEGSDDAEAGDADAASN